MQEPIGKFEIAPKLEGASKPADVIYHQFHARHCTDFESCCRVDGFVLRGTSKPLGYVDLEAVADKESITLSYSALQARTLGRMLIAAADDVDAALAKLAALKQGGAA